MKLQAIGPGGTLLIYATGSFFKLQHHCKAVGYAVNMARPWIRKITELTRIDTPDGTKFLSPGSTITIE